MIEIRILADNEKMLTHRVKSLVDYINFRDDIDNNAIFTVIDSTKPKLKPTANAG